MSHVADSSDLRERLVLGLLASAARFVPVPFLDDILREKATHLMVSRALKAHGRSYSSKKVQPLYSDNEGFVVGCMLFGVKLLLFPFRKLVSWVLALKYLAQDVTTAVLLGRALDRVLSEGRLAGASDEELGREADMIRRAFDNAVRGTDMALLQGVVRRALGSVSGLPRAALAALRGMRRSPEDRPTEAMPGTAKAKVDEGASKVSSALEAPEVKELLTTFDARFEENLKILAARAAT